jgi:hypothetical protein
MRLFVTNDCTHKYDLIGFIKSFAPHTICVFQCVDCNAYSRQNSANYRKIAELENYFMKRILFFPVIKSE